MYIKKIIVAILLLGLVVMGGFAMYVYNTFFSENTAFNNKEAHVYIPTNADFSKVIEELRPLLDNIESFAKTAEKKGYVSNIKPGHFIIQKGMNNNELINTLRSRNIPINIKFNNQERLEDLAGRISQHIEADSVSLIRAMRDSIFLRDANLTQETALGMYVPNTYELYWNTDAEAFRDRMKTEYERFWNENRTKKAKELGLSRAQVISLAAIVQKETAKIDERPRVAGVYMNRINKGMLLQADPTVIYAKKLTENDFDQVIKRVLYVDLEIDSPYNTYKYAGVPPGPIAMPDISSIDAVLNYEKHDYFYFVADVTNFGYHKFAKTLAQHNRNKAEYVRWVNENGVNR
ncbi:endolytic transglycosylase MltG [Constantimarinum furrinae]|uniref:Endolytic murein transglycosylase n=1 Tax=Constantimarinum furrinae TaxID=2562285 RepID=A0A7G8PQI2_9FLAO|nr:endolytic transglycosylase MltG [Constantimarinum furrinae]QNJ96598.1 aminodeoxychorismate lyase [Constantimarinum furrinae]